MPQRRRRILVFAVIAALYLVTWIGGWVTYKRDFEQHVHDMHARGLQRNAEMAAFSAEQGLEFQPIEMFPTPLADVDFCFPVLPGLLIADSSYVLGPLWGQGGLKIVIYYGFGTVEFPVGNWRS